MIYYAVIDTNVLVSSMLKPDSIPGEIIEKCVNGDIIPLINEDILAEYYEVLLRNKFGFNPGDVVSRISDFLKHAVVITPTNSEEFFKDNNDKIFYEVVLTVRDNDAYLVTGNIKHFPTKPFVVTPRQMLEIIKK